MKLMVWCDWDGRARWDIFDGECRVCMGWIPAGEEAGETLGQRLNKALQPGVSHGEVKEIMGSWMEGQSCDEETEFNWETE